MAKTKNKGAAAGAATATTTTTTSNRTASTVAKSQPDPARLNAAAVHWPRLDLSTPQVEHLVDNQIVLLRNALSHKTCRALISLFHHPSTSSPFSSAHAATATHALLPSPPARKGEAQRTNARFSIDDLAFAQQLYRQSGIKQLVEQFEPHRWQEPDGRTPKGLLSNIRIYRYAPLELFGPHYDSASQDPHTGQRTEWTVLFYLTGKEDGVVDGETVFYHGHSTVTKSARSKRSGEAEPIVTPLERGMAVLHRHGKACMLHEGRPPGKASKEAKWVLRSDLVFGGN
ncbi:uncharacterized protein PFL1_04136 [Pseudozyma flocculosa PF-1]|uniref:Prolyl 4-hydroxylase alpha subunit domain-containing protein n=1 Tax=Pseudozyma flocculosa PF-1 TaxID=1277687 RepID=A0A061H767_9BASI|nr:uncharacterized protein PFL1_04136 [Pseudozyma flocculosa PF-1]EPQ28309.1 hypothetical protein PFL1_04136 [Pseudozyma flocculosa PF-1]